MEEVNRLISLDALILIPLLILIVNIILIKEKEFKTVLVFHIAGFLNFMLEIIMVINGTRIVETENIFLIFLVLFDLSWIDMGFFCALAYVNINKLFNNSDISKMSLILINILFFGGMLLASLNWGITGLNILTRRLVLNPLMQPILQIVAVLFCSSILFFTGYRKLTTLLLLQGIIFGISFQSRLFIARIRQASNASVLTMIIDTLTLASMPIIAGAFLFIIFNSFN